MRGIIRPIGYIKCAYKSKFGIPRQAGLADTKACLELMPEYGIAEAFRGIEEFSHIWLLWEFSQNSDKEWSPTVRPPKLGGNKRVGVFATRSPFRPNSIGLSCVRLESVVYSGGTVILNISGADLMDGTPVYDIKPYLPYADCRCEATGGFTETIDKKHLQVIYDCEDIMPEHISAQLSQALSQDPRPSYHNEPERVYGMEFDKYNIRFKIDNDYVYIISIEEL